jgi:hypothetical protein
MQDLDAKILSQLWLLFFSDFWFLGISHGKLIASAVLIFQEMKEGIYGLFGSKNLRLLVLVWC